LKYDIFLIFELPKMGIPTQAELDGTFVGNPH
jgi:hypothetical protein